MLADKTNLCLSPFYKIYFGLEMIKSIYYKDDIPGSEWNLSRLIARQATSLSLTFKCLEVNGLEKCFSNEMRVTLSDNCIVTWSNIDECIKEGIERPTPPAVNSSGTRTIRGIVSAGSLSTLIPDFYSLVLTSNHFLWINILYT